MSHRTLLTSESVAQGHPDKVADQISDAVLDSILEKDPYGRVACETLVTTGLAFVAGEFRTDCYVEIPDIVRKTIESIGYTDATYGFDFETCAVITSIDEQSADISMGVDREGAGDQGLMFGYASRETDELMPLAIVLAHKLVRRLDEVRKTGSLPYLRPDGKSQVTVEYEDGRPVRVDTVVLSAQHHPDVSQETIKQDLLEKVIYRVIPDDLIDPKHELRSFVNPTGRFVHGGPKSDTGLTGRKIIVDTYGGVGSHGGGCLSGKDPTKVDRSGAYAARYVAKNIVSSGLAERCEIQIAYAIGIPEPVSIAINSFGTGRIADGDVERIVRKLFDLTPSGIIETLKLRRPVFARTAVYGHFGREEEGFSWEICDRVDDLRREA
jgi:S-adenosylmethionine synthetase